MAEEPPQTTTRITTEAELRAVTIGALQPLTGKVIVVDYDPAWPQQFTQEASKIWVEDIPARARAAQAAL